MRRLALVPLTLLALALPARAELPWQAVKSVNGVRYEKRAVEGSKFLEHRAIWFVAKEPKDVIELIWSSVESLKGKQIAERDVVRRGPTELVVHDYIRTPIVSDRELTLRFEKTVQPPYTISYLARPDLGPPPKAKRVVLTVVRGSWRVDPAPGGSEITYDAYSEPGGSVPAWVVRGPLQDQIMEDVGLLRARLR